VRKAIRALAVGALSSALVLSLAGSALAESQFGGNQGCTPGYWKTHPENWPGTNPSDDEYGLTRVLAVPSNIVDSKFGSLDGLGSLKAKYYSTTMLGALSLQGGPGIDGAAQILFRAAVAAYLNAADDRIDYKYRRDVDPEPTIRSLVQSAVSPTADRSKMIAVAALLDATNNAPEGCPL
jgi:hypothetical protein